MKLKDKMRHCVFAFENNHVRNVDVILKTFCFFLNTSLASCSQVARSVKYNLSSLFPAGGHKNY